MLKKRARTTLESGHTIGVIGWRSNHHTAFTRSISERKVRFYDQQKLLKEVAENIRFVLISEHVKKHRDTDKVKSVSYPIPLSHRLIVEILESCSDLLQSCPHEKLGKDTGQEILLREMPDDVLNFLTTPRGEKKMDKMACFTKAFLDAAQNAIKPGFVGKTTIGKIRESCGLEETSSQLVRAGWIEGETSEGRTKVGWYKAGSKMLAQSIQEEAEPEDPYELAKFLVAKKEGILAQKAEIDAMLSRIETAEKVLASLASLKK